MNCATKLNINPRECIFSEPQNKIIEGTVGAIISVNSLCPPSVRPTGGQREIYATVFFLI